ncbi:Hypothetical protein HDN1F_21800 [gamma proteobacterium HdN1]|nr:Hypothetical protein HDN1F_21800 [gamma proteobacterium HdN1]
MENTVAGYHTEEEQIQAIKDWWKDYGNTVLIGFGLALAILFGWKAWQSSAKDKSDTAATAYMQMQDAAQAMRQQPPVASAADGSKVETPQHATFLHMAEQIKKDYPDSGYAIMAALQLARDKVDNNDAAAAEVELRWALDHKPNPALTTIINMRLARVLAMKGDIDGGLKVLEGIQPEAQRAEYEEVKGDLYYAKGDMTKAREAYQASMNAGGGSASQAILKTKLDDLAVAE